MGGIFGRLVQFGLPGEQCGQPRQRLIAPLGQQVAMDAVFRCDLVEGLLLLQHLAVELGLLGRRVLFTHTGNAL